MRICKNKITDTIKNAIGVKINKPAPAADISNNQNNLESLMEALKYFYEKTKNRISYEYISFNGFNDSLKDAENLKILTRYFPVKVNIIEYNPIDDKHVVV